MNIYVYVRCQSLFIIGTYCTKLLLRIENDINDINRDTVYFNQDIVQNVNHFFLYKVVFCELNRVEFPVRYFAFKFVQILEQFELKPRMINLTVNDV